MRTHVYKSELSQYHEITSENYFEKLFKVIIRKNYTAWQNQRTVLYLAKAAHDYNWAYKA